MHLTKSSAIIITPTIGKASLEDAMNSVRNQTYSDILHLIVIDGPQYEKAVHQIVRNVPDYNRKMLTLPWNSGANKFNGHRIFAAFSFLVNDPYILFLDDDNWFDEEHVSSLVTCIEDKQLHWAFSMRKIFSPTKEFICLDNCESIGQWPPFSGLDNLVDTSCYCLKREVLLNAGSAWMQPYTGDRSFYKLIKLKFPRYQTTGLYTSNYRLSETSPPYKEFFLKGNEHMLRKYQERLPWLDTIT